MISIDRLTDVFVDVADTLVDDFDLIDFLHTLTLHAAAVSGADSVGLVLTDHHDQLRLIAASNESGEMLELLQLQNAEGPCLDCFRTGRAVVNADLASARDRWPTFAPRALESGFSSVHAFPMRLRTTVIGALNLFGKTATIYEPDDVKVVQSLADVATIALLQERSLTRAEALTEQLQGALNSRVVIEQAKGALAQREGITISAAFELLRARARSSQQSVSEVAQRLLGGDDLPG